MLRELFDVGAHHPQSLDDNAGRQTEQYRHRPSGHGDPSSRLHLTLLTMKEQEGCRARPNPCYPKRAKDRLSQT